MIPTALAVLFLILAYMLSSFTKPIFFIRFILGDMINPSEKNLAKINNIFKSKKHHPKLLRIFEWFLIQKIKKFLRKKSKRVKFINSVNLMIENVSRYAFDQSGLQKMIVSVIERYDYALARSLVSYKSHKAQPLIKFFRFLKRMDGIDLPYTFNAGQDILITVFGEPLVDFSLKVYKTDQNIFQEIDEFFGSQKDFIYHLYGVAV